MTFDWHPGALQEFEEAGLWYEEQRRRLGVEFSDAVVLAIESILREPNRFQPVGDGVRLFRLKRFPYHLYYLLDDARHHVRIMAVMHNRRRPDYWRERLS
jgi:plasmid stabilization system protein ParE